MGKIPMQPWFPDAHIADTAILTLEEQGAYRLLLDHLWIKGGALKDDDKEIARLLRISVRKWQKLKIKLEEYLFFFGGNITQKRLQRDYKNAVKKSYKNAENGRKGGVQTAENWKSSQANAVAKNNDIARASPNRKGSSRHISKVMDQL